MSNGAKKGMMKEVTNIQDGGRGMRIERRKVP